MFFMRTHISSSGIETVIRVTRKDKVIDKRFSLGVVGAIICLCSLIKPVIWNFRSAYQLISRSVKYLNLCNRVFVERLAGFISLVLCLSTYKQVWVSNYV